jgi:hypothetical protein
MKNILKISIISSLLIIGCLLIGACGSDSENLVQGKGSVDISTTISGTATPLTGVTYQVSGPSGYSSDPVTIPGSTTTWEVPLGVRLKSTPLHSQKPDT